MKILLILPPKWDVTGPSLGISVIATALKDAGHEVILKDYNVFVYHELREEFSLLAKIYPRQYNDDEVVSKKLENRIIQLCNKKLLHDIQKYNVDAVAFSVFLTSTNFFERMVRTIRKILPNLKIFAGGPALNPESATNLLNYGLVDAAVIGAGEKSVSKVVKFLEGDLNSLPIKGAFVKHKSEILKGELGGLNKLNEVPLPDFSGLDLTLYRDLGLPFLMSRGCVAKCTFCSSTFVDEKFNTLKAQEGFEWINTLYDRYGINRFFNRDLLMNGSHKILEDFVDLLLKSDKQFFWSGNCRVHKRLTNELIEKMAKAGCVGIFFGIESGSQKILDLMEKGVDCKETERVIKKCHESGIHVTTAIIIGYPQEEEADFQESLKLVSNLKNSINLVMCNMLAVTQDTPLIKYPKKYGIELGPTQLDWKSLDGRNTLEVRKKRLELFRSTLDNLGLEWI